jgi:hypothetical protein
MTDENCKYYKPHNNSERKFCLASSRLSGRAPGDFGELNYYFNCICSDHKKCSYFIDDNKLDELFNK